MEDSGKLAALIRQFAAPEHRTIALAVPQHDCGPEHCNDDGGGAGASANRSKHPSSSRSFRNIRNSSVPLDRFRLTLVTSRTLTDAFPPVLVVLRPQSRSMLEGRIRTLIGPSPGSGLSSIEFASKTLV